MDKRRYPRVVTRSAPAVFASPRATGASPARHGDGQRPCGSAEAIGNRVGQYDRLPDLAVELVGGLLGYGVDFLALYRRVPVFVDKILKGAKPGDIPVERPTRFEFAINMKTARALGFKAPELIRQRIDRVIE